MLCHSVIGSILSVRLYDYIGRFCEACSTVQTMVFINLNTIVQTKDIKTPTGRSDKRWFKMETESNAANSALCIGMRQDNGANHAPNCRVKVNKTLTKNKNIYVTNDLVVHVILCGSGNRKKKHLLNL
jgi:hypothetical protein